MREWRRRAELVAVGALFLVAQSQIWLGWNDGGAGVVPSGHRLARAALLVLTVLPLLVRRTRPLQGAVVVMAGIVLQVVLVAPFVPFLGGLLPLAVMTYSGAAYARRWSGLALITGLATEAVMTGVIAEERRQGEVLFGVFVLTGCWLAGDVVRHRVRRADRLVEEERARIARELHDVVAHSVSVMGVQAGAARSLLDAGDAPAARDAILAVEDTARSSVAELQRLLTILRSDDDLEPQPGLGRLGSLVEQVRAAGLPVTVDAADLPALSPGLDLTAYRVVQEALTNALKHSGGATRVRVATDDRELRLEVRNDGPLAAAGAPGHGLVGMRERVQLYAGTLDVGPDDGGFVVRACLPLP